MDASMDLFMKHFIKYVCPTKKRPVLLLLDNHSSHMSVNTLNIAKENHVHFLSFPAHCSHRLQPLDISVYGPMKKFSSSAASAWMLNNPGKTMSNIPTIISHSFPLVANLDFNRLVSSHLTAMASTHGPTTTLAMWPIEWTQMLLLSQPLK